VGSSLATRGGKLYRQTAPIRLYDGTATRSGMLAALARLAAEAQPEDVAVIFFAGHGAADGKDFYLLPADASLTAPALAGISTGDLAKAITKVPARKKVLIVDACQSGGGLSKLAAAIPRTPGTSIVLIASSLASAMEIRRLGHGILTHVLLEAVGDQPFTAMSLMRVVAEAVRGESSKYFPARPQQVTTISTGEDFPLVAGAAR